jgi:hypothetical protein
MTRQKEAQTTTSSAEVFGVYLPDPLTSGTRSAKSVP